MSSGSYNQVFVKCPFYCGDDGKNTVTCEGIVDGSYIKWKFRKKGNFQQQMKIFCCEYYQNCEVYRMLMENKYE